MNATAPLVDVHVLDYRDRPDWLAQCLTSLEDQPCVVHCLRGGWPDHIGAARAEALALGTAPYVAWMDDDDWALPGAFAACVDALEADPTLVGAYTDLTYLEPDGRRVPALKSPWSPKRQYQSPGEITHVKVLRRSVVDLYRECLPDWPTLEEYVLCGLMAGVGDWRFIPMQGAVKRNHAAVQHTSMRLTSQSLWERAQTLVRPALARAADRLNSPRQQRFFADLIVPFSLSTETIMEPSAPYAATEVMSLDDFCRDLSTKDRRVELISGFFAREKRLGRAKQTRAEFMRDFDEFMHGPTA